MKRLLLILFFTVKTASSQDFHYLSLDSTFLTTTTISDTDSYILSDRLNSEITIHGDTMKVIQLLLDQINKMDSIESAYYDLLHTSIDFANCVPDYWRDSKNNCKWKPYYALLKKEGFEYKHRTTKQKIKDCCK